MQYSLLILFYSIHLLIIILVFLSCVVLTGKENEDLLLWATTQLFRKTVSINDKSSDHALSIFESSHPYSKVESSASDAVFMVAVPYATKMIISFDPRSETDQDTDCLTFYTDAECITVAKDDEGNNEMRFSLKTFATRSSSRYSGNSLWCKFISSGNSKDTFGYKFEVQAIFDLDIKALQHSVVDPHRRMVTATVYEEKGGQLKKFAKDFLRELVAWPGSSAVASQIRQFAMLTLANITLSEEKIEENDTGTRTRGRPETAAAARSQSPTVDRRRGVSTSEDVKVRLRREFGFKFFFPPPQAEKDVLLLRTSGLCLSELLERSDNRKFDNLTADLEELLAQLCALAKADDERCKYYAIKALKLLSDDQSNQEVLFRCGVLHAFFQASSIHGVSLKLLQCCWSGIDNLSGGEREMRALQIFQKLQSDRIIDPAIPQLVTLCGGQMMTNFRLPVPLKQGKVYFEAVVLRGSHIRVGLSTESWIPSSEGAGLGDTLEGYAIDCGNDCGWHEMRVYLHSGFSGSANAQKCNKGTVIGVFIDFGDEQQRGSYVQFYCDGMETNIKFDLQPANAVKEADAQPAVADGEAAMAAAPLRSFVYFPAISLLENESITLRFAATDCQYMLSGASDLISIDKNIAEKAEQFDSMISKWKDVDTLAASFPPNVSPTSMEIVSNVMLNNSVASSDNPYYSSNQSIIVRANDEEVRVLRPGALAIVIKSLQFERAEVGDELTVYAGPQRVFALRISSAEFNAVNFKEIVLTGDLFSFRLSQANDRDNGLSIFASVGLIGVYGPSIMNYRLETNKTDRTQSLQKIVVKETEHNYLENTDLTDFVLFEGDVEAIQIVFDPQTYTERSYDHLTFFLDEDCTHQVGEKYSGDQSYWPGINANPPLVIVTNQFWFKFHSDGSASYWGYKFTATPTQLRISRNSTKPGYKLIVVDRTLVDSVSGVIAVDVGGGQSQAAQAVVEFNENSILAPHCVLRFFFENPVEKPEVKPVGYVASSKLLEFRKSMVQTFTGENWSDGFPNRALMIPSTSFWVRLDYEDCQQGSWCCRNQHPLTMTRRDQAWTCSVCSASREASLRQHRCNECDFSVCTTCIPRSLTSSSKLKFCAYQCFNPLGALSEMDNVLAYETEHPCTEDTNEKSLDISVLRKNVQVEDFAELQKCGTRDHIMEHSGVGNWDCDRCAVNYGRRKEPIRRWRCLSCNFDACFVCESEGSTEPQCNYGHPMEVCEGEGWGCDKCQQSLGRAYRWNCSSCQYDVCYGCLPKTFADAKDDSWIPLCIVMDPRTKVSNTGLMIYDATDDDRSVRAQLGKEIYNLAGSFEIPSMKQPLLVLARTSSLLFRLEKGYATPEDWGTKVYVFLPRYLNAIIGEGVTMTQELLLPGAAAPGDESMPPSEVEFTSQDSYKLQMAINILQGNDLLVGSLMKRKSLLYALHYLYNLSYTFKSKLLMYATQVDRSVNILQLLINRARLSAPILFAVGRVLANLVVFSGLSPDEITSLIKSVKRYAVEFLELSNGADHRLSRSFDMSAEVLTIQKAMFFDINAFGKTLLESTVLTLHVLLQKQNITIDDRMMSVLVAALTEQASLLEDDILSGDICKGLSTDGLDEQLLSLLNYNHPSLSRVVLKLVKGVFRLGNQHNAFVGDSQIRILVATLSSKLELNRNKSFELLTWIFDSEMTQTSSGLAESLWLTRRKVKGVEDTNAGAQSNLPSWHRSLIELADPSLTDAVYISALPVAQVLVQNKVVCGTAKPDVSLSGYFHDQMLENNSFHLAMWLCFDKIVSLDKAAVADASSRVAAGRAVLFSAGDLASRIVISVSESFLVNIELSSRDADHQLQSMRYTSTGTLIPNEWNHLSVSAELLENGSMQLSIRINKSGWQENTFPNDISFNPKLIKEAADSKPSPWYIAKQSGEAEVAPMLNFNKVAFERVFITNIFQEWYCNYMLPCQVKLITGLKAADREFEQIANSLEDSIGRGVWNVADEATEKVNNYFSDGEIDSLAINTSVCSHWLRCLSFREKLQSATLLGNADLVNALISNFQSIYDATASKIVKFTPSVIESEHPYPNSLNTVVPLVCDVSSAIDSKEYNALQVWFDERSSSENGFDYVRFFVDPEKTSQAGEVKYTGGLSGSSKNYPTKQDPLIATVPCIDAKLTLYVEMMSDGSTTDFGWIISAIPVKHAEKTFHPDDIRPDWKVLESSHPCLSGANLLRNVSIPFAKQLELFFDPASAISAQQVSCIIPLFFPASLL